MTSNKYLRIARSDDSICLYLVTEYDDFQGCEDLLVVFLKPGLLKPKYLYNHILNLARIISLETRLELIEED